MVNLLWVSHKVCAEIGDPGTAQFFEIGLQMGRIPFDQGDGGGLKQLAISLLAFPEVLLRFFQIGIVLLKG